MADSISASQPNTTAPPEYDEHDGAQPLPRNMLLMWPVVPSVESGEYDESIHGVPGVISRSGDTKYIFGSRLFHYIILGANYVQVGMRWLDGDCDGIGKGNGKRSLAGKAGTKSTASAASSLVSTYVRDFREKFELGFPTGNAPRFVRQGNTVSINGEGWVRATFERLEIKGCLADCVYHNITWEPDHVTQSFTAPAQVVSSMHKAGLSGATTRYPIPPPKDASNNTKELLAASGHNIISFEDYMRAHPQYYGYDARTNPLWDEQRDALPDATHGSGPPRKRRKRRNDGSQPVAATSAISNTIQNTVHVDSSVQPAPNQAPAYHHPGSSKVPATTAPDQGRNEDDARWIWARKNGSNYPAEDFDAMADLPEPIWNGQTWVYR